MEQVEQSPVENNETSSSPINIISDQERELANQAQVEFENKQYENCLQTLNKLGEIRQNDPKVVHNKAVVQFYLSSCTRTDEFDSTLKTIKRQIEKEADDSGEEVDDVDRAVLQYNQALIDYYVKHYNEAIALLERLYRIIEPLEETFAIKVCFLLLELYFATYQPDKASGVINYLDKMIYGNHRPLTEKTDKVGEFEGLVEGQPPQPIEPPLPQVVKEFDEGTKARFHEFKARLSILTKSMKACKKEIKSVMTTNSLAPEALFLKSNYEFLRRNYQKSIKLLNTAPKMNNHHETGDNIPCMYYNNQGCIHYQMQKYNLAALYFKKALEENDKVLMSLPPVDKNNPLSGRPLPTLGLNRRFELLYNLGLQLLHSGRPLAAFDCLIESVQVYHTNPRLWLRLAECCVCSHQMSLVDDYRKDCPKKSNVVQSVVGTGPHRKIVLPTVMEKSLSNDQTSIMGQSAAMPACTLEFAALCLKNSLQLLPANLKASPSTNTSVERQDSANTDSNKLLEEALTAQDNKETTNLTKTLPGPGTPPEATVPAPPGPPIKLHDIPYIRCCILACSSYVCLGLGDNVLALEHAQRLLAEPKLPGALRYLSHMYAAEALIKLNKISDAILHLSPENISELAVMPEHSEGFKTVNSDSLNELETPKPHSCSRMQFPESIHEARASFLINLASAHCLRSEFDKARKCLQQAASLAQIQELFPHALLLTVYIELENGNTVGALQILKKNQLGLKPGEKIVRKTRKSFS